MSIMKLKLLKSQNILKMEILILMLSTEKKFRKKKKDITDVAAGNPEEIDATAGNLKGFAGVAANSVRDTAEELLPKYNFTVNQGIKEILSNESENEEEFLGFPDDVDKEENPEDDKEWLDNTDDKLDQDVNNGKGTLKADLYDGEEIYLKHGNRRIFKAKYLTTEAGETIHGKEIGEDEIRCFITKIMK